MLYFKNYLLGIQNSLSKEAFSENILSKFSPYFWLRLTNSPVPVFCVQASRDKYEHSRLDGIGSDASFCNQGQQGGTRSFMSGGLFLWECAMNILIEKRVVLYRVIQIWLPHLPPTVLEIIKRILTKVPELPHPHNRVILNFDFVTPLRKDKGDIMTILFACLNNKSKSLPRSLFYIMFATVTVCKTISIEKEI